MVTGSFAVICSDVFVVIDARGATSTGEVGTLILQSENVIVVPPTVISVAMLVRRTAAH
jgi:hypothetical protein